MKRWTANPILDSLYKSLVFWVIAHALATIVAYCIRSPKAAFGIRMLWPHLQIGFWGWGLGIVGFALIWCVFYLVSKPKA